jgi:hypothetical protein
MSARTQEQNEANFAPPGSSAGLAGSPSITGPCRNEPNSNPPTPRPPRRLEQTHRRIYASLRLTTRIAANEPDPSRGDLSPPQPLDCETIGTNPMPSLPPLAPSSLILEYKTKPISSQRLRWSALQRLPIERQNEPDFARDPAQPNLAPAITESEDEANSTSNPACTAFPHVPGRPENEANTAIPCLPCLP